MFNGEIFENIAIVNGIELTKLVCSGDASIDSSKEILNFFSRAIKIKTNFIFDLSCLNKVSISFLQLLISFKRSAAANSCICYLLELPEEVSFFKTVNSLELQFDNTEIGFSYMNAQEIENAKDSCS